MKEPPVTKPVVLVFKESLLPISETFIEAQARSLSSFTPRYIGLGRVAPSLAVPSGSILLTSGSSASAQLRQKLYRRVGLAPRFHRSAASVRPSLIHAHFASGGRSALPIARRLHVPLIVTLHGSDVTTRIDFPRRYKVLWEEASLFVCVSEFIRRKAAAAGFPEEKLRVLYIGIDHSVFQLQPAPKDRDLILFVGRLVEKKGCSFMLQAIAEVQRWHPGVKAVVIGDGPLRHSLEDLAKRLNISCQFLGAQLGAVVRQWLAAARIFCAPSVTASNGDSEGLGMVFAEAQAMGTPVVSFRHGGTNEIVLDGRTGLLAPEGDANTLALHIHRLLEDDPFWKECVEHGIAWVRLQFDLKRQTRKLEQVYADVCHLTPDDDPKTGPIEFMQAVATFG
jgi:colanic acid/amylovoran biosynthesis glycosyltransferase